MTQDDATFLWRPRDLDKDARRILAWWIYAAFFGQFGAAILGGSADTVFGWIHTQLALLEIKSTYDGGRTINWTYVYASIAAAAIKAIVVAAVFALPQALVIGRFVAGLSRRRWFFATGSAWLVGDFLISITPEYRLLASVYALPAVVPVLVIGGAALLVPIVQWRLWARRVAHAYYWPAALLVAGTIVTALTFVLNSLFIYTGSVWLGDQETLRRVVTARMHYVALAGLIYQPLLTGFLSGLVLVYFVRQVRPGPETS